MPQSYAKSVNRLNKSERHLLSLLLIHGELTLAALRQEKQYKAFARSAQTLYNKGLLDKATHKGYKSGIPFNKVILKANMYSYCVQIPKTESRCKNASQNKNPA